MNNIFIVAPYLNVVLAETFVKDDLTNACDNHEIAEAMTDLYDRYYASHEYKKRYPEPNQSTLHFLFNNGAAEADDILDYGCGNGRYTLPLLQQTNAKLTAFDISHAAIAELAAYLKDHPSKKRIRLVETDAMQLNEYGEYDLILLLFGVLSHIGDYSARVATLKHLRQLIRKNGKLVLSVPSIFRRRPVELLQTQLRRLFHRTESFQMETGNILFTRTIGKQPHQFFYHLYTIKGLSEELREAGFKI
ncbi:MAG: class I SAM-dependent methyltransferase [Burkholderiales bacterium]|nr:class I SAM-dependent methyltransferase [Burkholderiales bacterium]